MKIPMLCRLLASGLQYQHLGIVIDAIEDEGARHWHELPGDELDDRDQLNQHTEN